MTDATTGYFLANDKRNFFLGTDGNVTGFMSDAMPFESEAEARQVADPINARSKAIGTSLLFPFSNGSVDPIIGPETNPIPDRLDCRAFPVKVGKATLQITLLVGPGGDKTYGTDTVHGRLWRSSKADLFKVLRFIFDRSRINVVDSWLSEG
jgi:hypothetical protein